VQKALATLPWVEQGTIEVDAKNREVHFALKDKSQFNLASMKQALKEQGFPEAEVRSGP
jgi:hypothetical protein